MKKEQFYFLLGGFAFGVLVGYGLFHALTGQPELQGGGAAAQVGAPAGPRAPGQGAAPETGGGGGGAPMVAEINEMKRRLEANPDDSDAAAGLGGLYYQVGMWDQALEFYEIALKIKPEDPNLLTDTGNVFRELGQYSRALDNFRQAHELDPGHWQALFNTVVVAAFDMREMELADKAMARLDEIQPAPPQLPALKQALAEFRARLDQESSS